MGGKVNIWKWMIIVGRKYDIDWGWNSGECPYLRVTWRKTHGQDARIEPKEALHQIEDFWIIESFRKSCREWRRRISRRRNYTTNAYQIKGRWMLKKYHWIWQIKSHRQLFPELFWQSGATRSQISVGSVGQKSGTLFLNIQLWRGGRNRVVVKENVKIGDNVILYVYLFYMNEVNMAFKSSSAALTCPLSSESYIHMNADTSWNYSKPVFFLYCTFPSIIPHQPFQANYHFLYSRTHIHIFFLYPPVWILILSQLVSILYPVSEWSS